MTSLRRNATPIWSNVSARYIGFGVKRYGPPRTIVVVGSDGCTFVPAIFINRTADIARTGAMMNSTIPMASKITRGKIDIGTLATKKWMRRLRTTLTAQINGGNAITPGLSLLGSP